MNTTEAMLLRARDLYAIYCASSDGRNYQGLPCPDWDALTREVRGHWYTVALRAEQVADSLVITPDGSSALPHPSASVVGHLPDLTHAIEVWNRYANGAKP